MAVEPCSRGGLPAYRCAARHPERIACIYGDVPVMDFKSWPYGRADSRRSDWPKIMQSYGFKNEAEAMAYQDNPIDQLAPIAQAKIPIRHVICLSDQIVPPEQNTLEAKRRLQKLGSDMEVFPHSDWLLWTPLSWPRCVWFVVFYHGSYRCAALLLWSISTRHGSLPARRSLK